MTGDFEGPKVDIAIIGGGPAGLCAAFALHKALPHLFIQVYEKADKYHECGAGISLDVNGMKSLRAIDHDLFNKFQKDVAEIKMAFGRRSPLAWNEEWNVKTGLIGWFELVKNFRDALPEGMIETGHALKDIELLADEHGSVLGFTNGHKVQAGLVVAADGYFSPVRQAVVPQDGPPEFADVVMWRARVPWREGLGLPEAEAGASTMKFDTGAVAMIYTLPQDMAIWTFTYKVERVREAGLEYRPEEHASLRAQNSVQHHRSADSSAFQRCCKVVEATFPQMLNIVTDTEPRAVVEHGLFTRPAEQVAALADRGWGRGTVTLLGDAAHSMRPTGQGLNTSLEDAAVLAWHLQQGGLNSESLRKFEKERIPRVSAIAKQEWARAASSYAKGVQLPMEEADYQSFKNSWEPPVLEVV